MHTLVSILHKKLVKLAIQLVELCDDDSEIQPKMHPLSNVRIWTEIYDSPFFVSSGCQISFSDICCCK